MNGDDPKSGFGVVPPEGGWEAQLTARLLGELSEAESQVLDRVLAQDPELARLEDRLRRTLDLVREAAAEPTEPAQGGAPLPRMSPGRRERLIERLRGGTVREKETAPGAAASAGAPSKTKSRVIPVTFGGDLPVTHSWRGSGWLAMAAAAVGLLLAVSILPDIQNVRLARQSVSTSLPLGGAAVDRVQRAESLERWKRRSTGDAPRATNASVALDDVPLLGFRVTRDAQSGTLATVAESANSANSANSASANRPVVADEVLAFQSPPAASKPASGPVAERNEVSSVTPVPARRGLEVTRDGMERESKERAASKPAPMEPRLMSRYGLPGPQAAGGAAGAEVLHRLGTMPATPAPGTAAASASSGLAAKSESESRGTLAKDALGTPPSAFPSQPAGPEAEGAKDAGLVASRPSRGQAIDNFGLITGPRAGRLAGAAGEAEDSFGRQGGFGGGGIGGGGGGGGAPETEAVQGLGRSANHFYADVAVPKTQDDRGAIVVLAGSDVSGDSLTYAIDPASGAVVNEALAAAGVVNSSEKAKADAPTHRRLSVAASGPAAVTPLSMAPTSPSGTGESRGYKNAEVGGESVRARFLFDTHADTSATVSGDVKANASEVRFGTTERRGQTLGNEGVTSGGATTWDYRLADGEGRGGVEESRRSNLGDVTTRSVVAGSLAGDFAESDKVRLLGEAAAPVVPGLQASDASAKGVGVLGDVPVLGQAFRKSETDEPLSMVDGEDRLALGRGLARGDTAGASGTPGGMANGEVSQTDFGLFRKKLAAPVPAEPAAAVAEVALRELESAPAPASAPPPAPAVPPPTPQPEVRSAENTVSTFSLNVSDVSFKLAGASLDQGQLPGPGTVRTEEFLNAFEYRDPEPGVGQAVGFAWERAQFPFAQQRDVLRFAVRTGASGREAGRPLNVVIALDNSGSMERADRVSTIREALRVLGGQLKAADRVSVVPFARTARLWIDGLPGDRAAELPDRVGELTPEGGTHLENALRVGYETALRHFTPEGVNRLVLLTDGAANLGELSSDALRSLVEEHRKRGVALDCFGIGFDGYQDDLLEALSRNGDGRYGFVNNAEEAATGFANQLAGALQVAASDVKVQVEFNPQRVRTWRQVGYAKHQLTQEQFRDNTVDAAEIGAAEAGNALYVIETLARGEGPIGAVRARYRDPGSGRYSEHEWVVPYEGTAVALEQASPAMRLATTAAAFGEMLSASPFASEVTSDRLLALMNGVPDSFRPDPRPERLEQMVRQTQSILGR